MTIVVRGGRALDGERLDFAFAGETIVAVGRDLPRGQEEIDAAGSTVLPGLHDHHLHILATAARRCSVDLSRCDDEAAVVAALREARGDTAVRAVAYDERTAGLPDAATLDRWLPRQPLRLQDRTGALWVFNSPALKLLPVGDYPPGAERDAAGRLTGRFWREDRWLGERVPLAALDLAGLGRELAGFGLTGLTDAGPRNGPREADTLGQAHATGALAQRLVLMGGETLPVGENYRRGPLKLLIDERDPPDLGTIARRITTARGQGRAVAAHCVTATELALYLAALDEAGGARHGDRVEHGGVIGAAAVRVLAATPLIVVTNPAFVHDRGDRYLATVDPGEQPELYRAASLSTAGIGLAAGSDAPYASADPWLGMRAARDRLTASGRSLGPDERLTAVQALGLYLGDGLDPAGSPRRLAAGGPADFIVCRGDPGDVLADLDAARVQTTVIAGRIVFSRDGAASTLR